MTTRYSLGELASKITKAIQHFDEQELQDSCSGRRADDGRWYWHCLCTPKGHASSAATASHTTDGGNLAGGMMQQIGGTDGSAMASRGGWGFEQQIIFDIEIVQLAIKRSTRRRDGNSSGSDRCAYILQFYNKTQLANGQRMAPQATQADQAMQERFRMVTSKLLKLVEL